MAFLGVDLGTSAVKAVVVDEDGVARSRASASYEVQAPRPGWSETDPERWWGAVAEAGAAAVSAAGRHPVAVGLSGQMHGLVATGEDGRAVRPAILWPDSRAEPQLAAYRRLPPPSLARLANPLAPGMVGPLLRWIADHEPDTDRRTRWALLPKDWLRLRMTGRVHSEPSDASATLLYDVAADGWDLEVTRALGLDPERLPPLRPSDGLAGTVEGAAARALGLPSGTPVAAGAGDVAAAAFGTGLTRPGPVQLVIGTGAQFVTLYDRPHARPARGTHLYRTAAPVGWYGMAAILSAGLALDWVRRVLGVTWEDLYEAAALPPGDEDPLFLPHLAGERTPYLDPRLRGAWVGLGLAHDRSRLLRAALEGAAFALRDGLEALEGGAPTEPVRLAGGGSTHPAWRQMLADVLDRPLHALDAGDASARGAALLAGVAVGGFRRDEIGQRLAPAPVPVAEPRAGFVEHYAVRHARFRIQVLAGLPPSAPD